MYNFTRVRWESCGIPHGLINLIIVYYNKILTKVEERRDTTSSTSFACMCETSVLFYGFVLFVVLWTSDIILYTFWSKNLLYLIRSSSSATFSYCSIYYLSVYVIMFSMTIGLDTPNLPPPDDTVAPLVFPVPLVKVLQSLIQVRILLPYEQHRMLLEYLQFQRNHVMHVQ